MSPPPIRVLSLIPPMTQLNTPYPSTAYLTGFLRSRGVHATQADLALGLALRLLSRAGLQEVHTPGQKTIAEIAEFLKGSEGIDFTGADRAGIYKWVELLLVNQEFASQSKKQRGAIRQGHVAPGPNRRRDQDHAICCGRRTN